VAGRRFTPREQPRYDATGPASWYGEDFNHRMTSNGEWFNMNDLTAAHPTLPLPSYVKVTNLDNGREIVVRVNDRGPFVGPRIIDMSKRSAEVLGFKDKGKARVRVQYIGAAPLNDQGSHLAAMNRGLQQGTPRLAMIAAADRSEATSRQRGPVSPLVAAQPDCADGAAAPANGGAAATASVSGSHYIIGLSAMQTRWRAPLSSVLGSWSASASGSEVYRVRIGPIAGETDAMTALQDAIGHGHPDANVIAMPAMQAAL
jgi:rare lipoprotein A